VDEAKNNPKQFQDSLEDIVSKLEDDGKAPGYVANIIKIIRSWLKYNNILLTRHIKIKNSSATPTIENEQIPSQQELARLLRNSSRRLRVAEALLAFADLRPETVGNFDGSDGLRLSDLSELVLDDNRVVLEKMPTMIVVRSTLSKAKHKYFTFLSAEGCAYLREFLEERIRAGESLLPSSPLISHERTEVLNKPFMLTRTITNNNAITAVLAPLISVNAFTIVSAYTGKPRTWKSFSPGKPSSLTTIVDGNGYWIYMNGPADLTINGTIIPTASNPPSYALVFGWNLVGYKPQPTIINETVGLYLSSISGSYDQNNVWVYDNTAGSWTRGTSTTLTPGEAMWILVTSSSGATLRP
jgi:hypothetical protein